MRRKLLLGGLFAFIVGGIATGVGWVLDPKQASHSYLFAFSTAFSLVVGMLFLLLIGNASNARWFVPLRRVAEDVTTLLPLLALLFVPALLSIDLLYAWAGDVHALPFEQAHLVEKRLGYLNAPFFIARAVLVFAALIVVAVLLRRWSLRQDRGDAERYRGRILGFSAAMLPVVSVVVTFAAWDWLMSLNPVFFSNIYGVYYFGGGVVAALSLMALVVAASGRIDDLPLGRGQSFAVGRLMLTFVIFWMYIGFAQTLLVWIADLPDEVVWYLDRWSGGWQWFGLALVVAHFCLPFAVLLSQGLKRRPRALAAVAVWILLAHAMDQYYLVLPELHPRDFAPHWLDLAALVAVLGACCAFAALRVGRAALLPVGDPVLGPGLRYEGETG